MTPRWELNDPTSVNGGLVAGDVSRPGDIVFRPVTDEEFPRFLATGMRAFGTACRDEHVTRERLVFELDRTTGMFDGDRLVGTGGIFSLQMSVPGRVVPVAGVTFVSVAATHRRRGLLTRLMRHQLHGLHAAGREPIAALWASESSIYRRFGYGPASQTVSVEIRRDARAIDDDRVAQRADFRLSLRDEPAETVLPEIAAIHAAHLPDAPGEFARDDRWWQYRLSEATVERRSGWTPLSAVVISDTGYALYRTKSEWSDGVAAGEVEILEIVAAEPTAQLVLWDYLLRRDLMATWRAWLAIDDPILLAAADSRRLHARLADNLWVRIVDVDRALAARRYSVDIDLVLEVADEFCPWNNGRWRLIGGPDGASCEPTRQSAHLAVPAWALGAAYLGTTSLYQLARGGWVSASSPAALAQAASAFRWPAAAHCSLVF